MQTAQCPSCGSPVVFRHAAAVTVVCRSCHSAVYRSDQSIMDLGVVSSMARDLSPIQIGAQGRFGNRLFSVVGVLRKGRDRVRWNEWFIDFGDGSFGWLSEGNAEYQLFLHTPVSGRLPDPQGIPAGGRFQAGGMDWTVTESASASVLAAEGELPFKVGPNEHFSYVDMKSTSGRAGTLDKDAWGEVQLWIGDVVDLQSLQMRGLRAFAGWTDEAELNFAGPELTHVRSLKCPNCAAPLELRDPGQTAKVGCGYCGSELGTSESGGGIALAILKASSNPPFQPSLPLGSIGSIRGMRWQVIGAMVRFVRADGIDWNWTEYLLHAPYRGYAWLVQDSSDHWSYVRKLPDVPAADSRRAVYRGTTFKSYTSGVAQVLAVLGEFYWEVREGDRAATKDYIAPPAMLSMERTKGEVHWSMGAWLSSAEISEAFGLSRTVRSEGVAPHQPNPYRDPAVQRLSNYGSLGLLLVFGVLWMAAAALLPARTLMDASWLTQGGDEAVLISDEFEVRGALRRDLTIEALTPISPKDATLHVALVNVDDGKAFLPWPRRKTTSKGTDLTAFIPRPTVGRYVIRAEVAAAPDEAGVLDRKLVTVKIVQRKGWIRPVQAAGLIVLLAWLARFVLSSRFEQARWLNSDDAIESDEVWRPRGGMA